MGITTQIYLKAFYYSGIISGNKVNSLRRNYFLIGYIDYHITQRIFLRAFLEILIYGYIVYEKLFLLRQIVEYVHRSI